MAAPPWSEEELATLKKTYPAYGSIGASRLLRKRGFSRTPSAVNTRAGEIGLLFNVGKHRRNLVPLVDVHSRYEFSSAAGKARAHKRIIESARRDGVLRRTRAYPRMYMAPREWVDRYVELRAAQEEAEAEITRTWLTTPQVAELLGSTKRTVSSLASPRRENQTGAMYAAVNRMTRLRLTRDHSRGSHTVSYWEPSSVHREVAWYRAARNARIASRRRSGNGVMERRVA